MSPTLLPAVASLLYSLSALPSTNAHPLSNSKSLSKRGASPENIGLGFGLSFSVIIFACLVFYLGVRRGQTGSWAFWKKRSPPLSRSPTVLSAKFSVADPDQHSNRARISMPVPMHSTTIPNPSPVQQKEKYKKTPEYLELEAATNHVIFELGENTPRRPPSSMTRKSFFSTRTDAKSERYSFAPSRQPSTRSTRSYRKSISSRKSMHSRCGSDESVPPMPTTMLGNFGRQSWFGKSARDEDVRRAEQQRDEEDENEAGALPPYPGPTLQRVERRASVYEQEEEEFITRVPTSTHESRKTKKVESGMDWTGMEWLRKVYTERKSVWGLKSFHPRE
jgi:hypothetical protein